MSERPAKPHTAGTPVPALSDAEFPQTNIAAVRAIAGAVASTLGPTPNDKLVVTELASRQPDDPANPPTDEFAVTTDGQTILDHLPLDHPIAPLITEIAGPEPSGDADIKGQSVPDGVTTTTILAAALLDEAEDLLDMGLHPTDIRRGYQRALSVATEELDSRARPLSLSDREIAVGLARTAMTGNDVGGFADTWASLAVDVVEQVGRPTPKSFAIRTKRTGSIGNSQLINGAVLDRVGRANSQMPKAVEDAEVLVVGGHNEGGLSDPTLDRDWSIQADTDTDTAALATAFDARKEQVVQDIVTSGADVVITRLGIGSEYSAALATHDILGIRRVNRLKLSQVANATGATTVQDITDIQAGHLGSADRITVTTHDPRPDGRNTRKMTIVKAGANSGTATALLTGMFEQGGEQLTRQLRKGAQAVAAAAGYGTPHDGYLPGGGAADMAVAAQVRSVATSENDKVQLATERFADAVEVLPFTLAKNAGRDPLGMVADVRAKQTTESDGHQYGLVGTDQSVENAIEAKVVDPHKIRRECYTKATQVANLVLGIDNAVQATFSTDTAGPGDVIYDDRAESQQAHLDKK